MTAAIRAMPQPTRKGTAIDSMLAGSEDVLLAALLNRVPEALAKLSEVKPELFVKPANREIFCAIRDVYEGGRAEVSAFTVTHRLNDIGRLAQVGGYAEVTRISLEGTNAAIFDFSLEVMRDAARDRDASRIVDGYQSGKLTLPEMREHLAEIGTAASATDRRSDREGSTRRGSREGIRRSGPVLRRPSRCAGRRTRLVFRG